MKTVKRQSRETVFLDDQSAGCVVDTVSLARIMYARRFASGALQTVWQAGDIQLRADMPIRLSSRTCRNGLQMACARPDSLLSALGGRDFVEKLFERHRIQFRRKRKTGACPMPFGDWPQDMCTSRKVEA